MNCSLAIWLATIVGGVASEVKRIVVPLNGAPTSFSQVIHVVRRLCRGELAADIGQAAERPALAQEGRGEAGEADAGQRHAAQELALADAALR